ncbi:MAG: prepilin peptidase [Henriciella sp.]|nr:prepilin peptidase [Henriciella sp.]
MTAIIATAVLATIYAIVFVAFASPSRTIQLGLYASFVLGASLLILSYLDLRTGLLLDVITLPLIILGIGYALVSGGSWPLAVAGAGLGYGLVAGLGYVWRRTRGYEGIGLGDAKLLAVGGAWVGAGLIPLILLIASGLGMILALTVLQKPHGADDRGAIPFGPALSLGIWVAWCAGETIFA